MTLHQIWDLLMPEERRWLGLFVLLSFLIHFSIFFLFRTPIDFTAQIHRSNPPRITLLSIAENSSTTSQNPSAWWNIFDPRLLALPTKQDTIDPHTHSNNPSLDDKYLTSLPLPDPIPVNSTTPTPFGKGTSIEQMAIESLSLVQPDPKPILVESPPRVHGTRVIIHGPLSTRGITRRSDLPQPPSTQTLRATVLRIAVDASGTPSHILIDESSGDSNVDAQAATILGDWRFTPLPPDSKGIEWGRATVFWDLQTPPDTGNDKETP